MTTRILMIVLAATFLTGAGSEEDCPPGVSEPIEAAAAPVNETIRRHGEMRARRQRILQACTQVALPSQRTDTDDGTGAVVAANLVFDYWNGRDDAFPTVPYDALLERARTQGLVFRHEYPYRDHDAEKAALLNGIEKLAELYGYRVAERNRRSKRLSSIEAALASGQPVIVGYYAGPHGNPMTPGETIWPGNPQTAILQGTCTYEDTNYVVAWDPRHGQRVWRRDLFESSYEKYGKVALYVGPQVETRVMAEKS